jgi:paraquat-inducible protein A
VVPARLAACRDCDLLQALPELPEGATALCRRCGGVLRRRRRNTIERTLALSLASAVLFVVANAFPFLSFAMKGQVTTTTLLSGVLNLYEQGRPQIAALVGATTVAAPFLQIALLVYVLLPLHLGRVPWRLPAAFRLVRRVTPWSMMEVFLIGILVSITKLAGMAQVVPGLALWAFALLMLVLTGALASLDPEAVWERAEEVA